MACASFGKRLRNFIHGLISCESIAPNTLLTVMIIAAEELGTSRPSGLRLMSSIECSCPTIVTNAMRSAPALGPIAPISAACSVNLSTTPSHVLSMSDAVCRDLGVTNAALTSFG